MARRLLSALLLAAALPQAAAFAAPPADDPAALCERAIADAARRHGTPERLLRALSHIESGRSRNGERRPWPWTVNAAGEGRWFESRGKALAFIRAKRAAGVRSIDIGCLQLNAIWHGEAFSSLEEMLDPEANADYAARYLADLKRETGDWMRAAGYYHSRTPQHFDRYSALVRTAYASLKERAADLAAPRPAPAPPPVAVALVAPEPPRRRPAEPVEGPPSGLEPVWRGLLRGAAPLRLTRPARPLLSERAAPAPLTAAAGTPPRPAPAESGRRAHGGVALAFASDAKPLIAQDAPPRQGWLKP